ncbi:hypothetical protein L2E82_34713 [Cichorium intybus]|uniref:Uncharacterized protein n=1 Tax=Cichorium intybus TaxID=13427 RepID=A0ACB9BMK7_CICIN|nr:hypothetical protein L2E82_34713 [Cichorium intybus]
MGTGILTKESDVYSFGVVLFEVLCGRLCVGSNDKAQSFTRLDEMHPSSVHLFSKSAYECLKGDIAKRPLIDVMVTKLETALKYQQGDGRGGNLPPPSGASQSLERQRHRNGNKVYKSGPLFLSSKGIGWTSWKKRWFVLTKTSLVFFRSDPSASSKKGGESNLTLGGIDLNSSGSLVVREDTKLLTLLFPDGRDGRSYTLKADTLEDLHEWKTALEEALSNAPTAGTVMGQ